MRLNDLLAASTERDPDRLAVRAGDAELTYGQLLARARGLARALRDQDVRQGDRVGLFCEKTLDAVAGLYGILESGAAYVPLDVTAPPARIAVLLRDCGLRHVVTHDAMRDRLALALAEAPGIVDCVLGASATLAPGVRTLAWAEMPPDAHVVPDADGGSDSLAYILYTSGSTGVPKGITHTHRSARAFVDWAVATFQPVAADRLASHAPFHFDLSIFDLFAAATAGAAAILIPNRIAMMPASLSQLIADERLTFWYSVPFALINLLDRGALHTRDLRSLRCVLFAGEQLPMAYLTRLRAALPQARLANLYGPTETNVCTWYEVPSAGLDSLERLPIGHPCGGTELLVVDAGGCPVAPRDVGELLVRGPSVMTGYWGNEAATARAFTHPQGTPAGAAFYRTGDLVRQDDDGACVFLGRADRQIKHRGYRIELDEIEGALQSHDAVQEAVVYVTGSDRDTPDIVAAAVLREPSAVVDGKALLAHLAARLPAYAVPATVTVRQAFPRTSTGKIDRNALRAGA